MTRPYGKKFLDELALADDRQMGVKLGKLCVEAKLPAVYVARGLRVSRMTVYNWFRGQDIRKKKRPEVEALIGLIQNGLKDQTLPAKNIVAAKLYISEISGVSP